MPSSNFVDYVKIFGRSGNGGSGSSHFRREKFVEFGGPDGGDGGKGGSIILRGNSQFWTLIHLKYQRHIFAENGEAGGGARSTGKNGKDVIIDVPLGTVARDVETGKIVGEVTENGQELVLLPGGRGGLGNWHFKSATNQAPRYSQPREEYRILLNELQQYNPELMDKQRLLAITKTDLLDEELQEALSAELPEGVPSLFISSATGYHLPQLKDMLWDALQKENR